MNKLTKQIIITVAICLGTWLGFVTGLAIYAYQQSQKIIALEQQVDELQEVLELIEEINPVGDLQSRMTALEHDFKTMEIEVCGDPCYLDPTMHYVSRLDELENDFKIFVVSLNPDRANLNQFLRDFCHQAMLDGEYDQWEVCEYLSQ